MRLKYLFLILFTIGIFICSIASQNTILFNDISLGTALALAKEKKKNIFIDTYADWCIPCKKMELEFKKKEFASFFNESYINVRINMDYSLNADQYRKEFDVVFLPTMVLIDANGTVKFKTDKIIPGDELLAIAKKSLSPNVFFLNESADIIRDPMASGSQSVQKGPDVVVHKLGAPNQNPDIMMKEAYFRIELMDGSHRKTADNYLATQKDWSSKKNMRFILDFIYNAKSPEFIYLVNNIDSFRTNFGVFEINQTMNFLINDELQKGYPRPNYEEALKLFGILDKSTAEEETMKYFMERYLDECNIQAYRNIASDYLQKYTNNSAEIYATIGLACLEKKGDKVQLESCINATKKAVEIQQNIPYYYEQLANLYKLKGDKKQAKKSMEKALEMAKFCKHNLAYYEKLVKEF